MPTPRYFITRIVRDPVTLTVHTYYRDAVTGGTNLYAELSERAAPLDAPNWTDDDHCEALAVFLGVSPSLVAMEPVPPEPEPEEEEE